MKLLIATAFVVAGLSSAVLAQAPEGTPERVRGTIDTLEGDTLQRDDARGTAGHAGPDRGDHGLGDRAALHG